MSSSTLGHRGADKSPSGYDYRTNWRTPWRLTDNVNRNNSLDDFDKPN